MTQTVTKVLAGHEDFALGQGTTNQTRQSTVIPITQIDLNWIFNTLAEIKALDVTKYNHAAYANNNALTSYSYSSSSTATVDGVNVLLPDIGVGRWLIINEPATNVIYSPQFTGGTDRTVTARLNGTISPLDFSDVDGTGATDSTVGFTAAMAWCMLTNQGLELIDGDTYKVSTWAFVAQTGRMVITCSGKAIIDGTGSGSDFFAPNGNDSLFIGIAFTNFTKSIHNTTIATMCDKIEFYRCHFFNNVMAVELAGLIKTYKMAHCTYHTLTHSGFIVFADQATCDSVVMDDITGPTIGSTNVLSGQAFAFAAFGQHITFNKCSFKDFFGNSSTVNVQAFYSKATDVICTSNSVGQTTLSAHAAPVVEWFAQKGDATGGSAPFGRRAVYLGNSGKVLEGTGYGIHSEVVTIANDNIEGVDDGITLTSNWTSCTILGVKLYGNDKTIVGNDGLVIGGASPEGLIMSDFTLKTFNRAINAGPSISCNTVKLSDGFFLDIDTFGLSIPSAGSQFNGWEVANIYQDSGSRFINSAATDWTSWKIKDNSYDNLTDLPYQWINMTGSAATGTLEMSGNGPSTVQTTDATATTIAFIPLSINTVGDIDIKVVGRKSDGSERNIYKRRAMLYRNAGASVLEGSVDAYWTVESDASWNVTIAANSNGIRVQVVGVAADIDWRCHVEANVA